MSDHGLFSLDGVPYWATFVAAMGIVFFRTQAIYWLGWWLTGRTHRSRWSHLLDGPRVIRAIGFINRWGAVAVTLSFLTVGIQTVINITAGYTRMPWWRYTCGLVPGCAIWAAIWTTIGTVAYNTLVLLAATSPLGLAITGFGLAAFLVWLTVRTIRRVKARRQDLIEAKPSVVPATTMVDH